MSDPVEWGELCVNGGSASAATIVSTLPTINAFGGGSAGTLQFTTSAQSVNEDAGTYVVHVSRASGSTGAASVVVSRDGTSNAVLSTDYTTGCTFPCTLNWSDADATDKTITLTIINRAGSQSSRHLDLSLGSATGATIGLASAFVLTINDVSAGAQTQWNPGFYGDCLAEVPNVAVSLGNPNYNSVKACIDYWALQTPTAKGVYIEMSWASYEGDTAGCYDSTCSNQLSGHVAGRIGYPLIDDLLSYAASKGVKVIFGIEWARVGGYGGCGYDPNTNGFGADGYFPAYLRNWCSGTDGSNTYGVIFLQSGQGFLASMWKSATMAKYNALAAAYGDRYDNNTTLEGFVLMVEEGDMTDDANIIAAGGTTSALASAEVAINASVKPHWPHTNVWVNFQWNDPVSYEVTMLADGNSDPTHAIGFYTNDLKPDGTSAGEAAWVGYTGVCNGSTAPCWGNTNTTNYTGTLPSMTKPSDELCGGAATGANTTHYTPQQFWDAAYTPGKTDSGARSRPSHWIFSRTHGPNYCPTEANQAWGTDSSGGWKQFVNGHAIPAPASSCPTAYTGGCN
jgi:hypothetical protein